jgi:type VI secretion system protein
MRVACPTLPSLPPLPSRLWLPLLFALTLLGSCGALPPTSLKQIQVVAEIGANQDTATALDIVFVYDSNAVSLLPKTGPAWFAQKAALVAGLATSIEVVSLQVPPVTLVTVPLTAHNEKAVGVYGFANYLTVSGQAAGNLTPYKSMQIWLTPSTVLYQGN